MTISIIRRIAMEFVAAAQEIPWLFFAPLMGAVRGAYIETKQAWACVRN